MKTLAAVLYEINRPLVLEELLMPELKEGQVLVEIAYSGICHTQSNEIHGRKGEDKFLPHTLGHEGAGRVLATGEGVKKVKPGDPVVLTWIRGSGYEVPSVKYENGSGRMVNSGAISTFMKKSVVSENRLVKIPDHMPLKEAALLGCAIPTGVGMMLNTIKALPGNSVAIFGVGGIGLSALLAAVMAGAKPIIAVDVVKYKLGKALELGATDTINAAEENVLKIIMEVTNNRGVDFAIEAAGKCESMETAFQSVRDGGGVCVVAGNPPQGERISINPFDLIRGKRIVGTWGGESQPDHDIPTYVDYFLAGKLPMGNLISHTYSLERINEAMEKLEHGEAGRILIDMNDSGSPRA